MNLKSYSLPKERQLTLLAGIIVSFLGALGILAHLLNLPILGSFSPDLGMKDAMAMTTSISLFFLGLGAILSLQFYSIPAVPSTETTTTPLNRLCTAFLLIPGAITLSTLISYLVLTHFELWQPLVHSVPQVSMSFHTAINVCLLSFGLIAFNRYRHIWWISYGLGLIGLFVLESACFSVVGRWSGIPVLFSFIQAIPSTIALIIMGLLLMFVTIPYQGFLSPIISSNLKIRRFGLLGVAISILILLAGMIIISLFHTIIAANSSPIEVGSLFVSFEISTILLSVLVMALSLRLLVYFENSLLSEHNAKDSEMRFRLLVSAVQDYAIYMLDPNGRIETWNEGAERITGYQPSEILGQDISIFYPATEVEKGAPRQPLELTERQGHAETMGWRLRKDGQLFWAWGSLTALRSEAGILIGFSEVIRDLTAQKHMEDSLKASVGELSNMKQAIDAASIVAMTDEQGIITYVNDAFCNISKYNRDELIGHTHRLVNSHYHPKTFFNELWKTIANGQIWQGEIRNRAKDGTLYWVDTTIYPFRAENGMPERYIAIHHDITPLKTAEEELKKHAHQQKIISILSQHALAGLDIDTLLAQTAILTAQALKAPFCKILELQPNAKDFILKAGYGWKEGEVGHATISAEEDSQAGFTLLVDEPVIVQDFSKETRFKRTSLLLSHAIVSGMSVIIRGETSNRPFGVLGVHTLEPRKFTSDDIIFLQSVANVLAMAIERKHSETKLQQFNWELERNVLERTHELELAKQQAEEANRQKTRVLAFVSHDFKNPLAAMSRFADIIDKQEDHLTEKQRELIHYISEGIAQLRAMVTSILDKARLEDGQLTLSLEWIELAPLLSDLKPIIDSLAEQRNITITVNIQPPNLGLEADPRFLRQIMLNLISNATKYNKRNGQVWVNIHDTGQPQFIAIEVRDTGIGIPQEKIPELFKEYFRAGPASLDQIEGTGLGLAFIKKLVEMHGGQITVESQVGVGSTFTVTLPNRVSVGTHLGSSSSAA